MLKLYTKTCPCGAVFQTRHKARQTYCTRECNVEAQKIRARLERRTTCLQCGSPMEATNARVKFCSSTCRKANFVARHTGDDYAPLDADGEITVKDLESAPRRLRVAKLFDLFEGAGNFEHAMPAQWMRPQDRRARR